MADPDLSLIVVINTETGETYVSLEAIGELTLAIETVKHNLAEIEDCLTKIKAERARVENLKNDELRCRIG